MFRDYTSKVEEDLAKLLGKVSHHLHPEITSYLIEANSAFREEFASYAPMELEIDDFLHHNSDCIFPGVRRPVNKETAKAKWKNNIHYDGTILNDNTYPRHLWTYLVCNKGYSSSTWKNSGLNNFELAHIFNHKTDETELERRCFSHFDETKNPYALFTSASNVVLISKGLTKPTDKLESIKLCFYKRHIDLYGENFYHMSGFNESLVPDWYAEIYWLDPIVPDDWRQKIDNLLKYRAEHLRIKYGGSIVPETQRSITKSQSEELNTIDGESVKHTATRFYIDERIYKALLHNSEYSFSLTVNPVRGKHPKGIYIIPNRIIVGYIESKRGNYNWEKNKTYHQDGVPKDLKNYFRYR